LEELDDVRRGLVDHAMKAADNAYAPYSNFHVGAATLLDNGIIVCGNNQENAAYPSGLCAERVTLFAAGANYPDNRPTMFAIAAKTPQGFMAQPIPPCGACRQVMMQVEERYNRPLEVLLYGTDGIYCFDSASYLMPFSFKTSCMEGCK
jgi:Cytidine deaminase